MGLDKADGGIGAGDLAHHLQSLKQEVEDWLEAQYYQQQHPSKQKAMRKQALMPVNHEVEMPEVYHFWQTCKDWNTLWWSGGLGAQPHLLMLEFGVCAAAHRGFQGHATNIEKILNG